MQHPCCVACGGVGGGKCGAAGEYTSSDESACHESSSLESFCKLLVLGQTGLGGEPLPGISGVG